MATKITSAVTRETAIQIDGRTILVTLGPDDHITLRLKGLRSGYRVSIDALFAFAQKRSKQVSKSARAPASVADTAATALPKEIQDILLDYCVMVQEQIDAQPRMLNGDDPDDRAYVAWVKQIENEFNETLGLRNRARTPHRQMSDAVAFGLKALSPETQAEILASIAKFTQGKAA